MIGFGFFHYCTSVGQFILFILPSVYYLNSSVDIVEGFNLIFPFGYLNLMLLKINVNVEIRFPEYSVIDNPHEGYNLKGAFLLNRVGMA